MSANKTDTPQIYTVSPGNGLLSVLADHLLFENTFGSIAPSELVDLSDVTLLLPTKRAVKTMRDIFLARSDGKASILPQMRALGDVDEAELVLDAFSIFDAEALDLPETINPLHRQLLLAAHVAKIYPDVFSAEGDTSVNMNPSAFLRIAGDLLALLDSAEIEQVELSDLSSLVADQFAENWQQTVAFLRLITQTYPADLKKLNLIEPMAKRNKLIALYGKQLDKADQKKRIIAAGSTGSTPATRDLLSILARVPNGAVILPGLDQYLDDETWAHISDDHPQNAMKGLLDSIGLKRRDVRELKPKTNPVNQIRAQLMSEVMRPAEDTDKWFDRLRRFNSENVEQALQPVTVITAPSERDEALIIALRLRSVLETPGKTAALVTPDRGLANRVLNEMKRWGLELNDSAGRKLSTSPKAKALLLIANCLRENFSPISLLSLLRHESITAGLLSHEMTRAVLKLDMSLLRGPRPAPGLEGLRQKLAKTLEEEEAQEILLLLSTLEKAFAPFKSFERDHKASLRELCTALLETYETLSVMQGDQADAHIWAGEDGEALSLLFAELLERSDLCPALPLTDLREYLETLMNGSVLRHTYNAHPRLYIFGLLEARLISCDVMILGGMNEGVWPQIAGIDPWLNRPMRGQLSMPAPERRIGLSAHDFVQNFCASEVVVTRSEKVDGVPTVPSRWLLRLKAVLETAGNYGNISKGENWVSWARMLDKADDLSPVMPPKPTPPVAARPRRLSVTQIETWQRDPYAIYARHILRLKKLHEIDAEPSYAEKGTLIHKIMERYTRERKECDQPLEILQKIGAEEFDNWSIQPSVTAFWQPRFERIAEWYVSEDNKLREGLRAQYAEVRGELNITTQGGSFKLHGVADRIDELGDGSLRIIDYKTGLLPGKKEVGVFASQMPLEAHIAMEGGFDNIPSTAVSQMVYVKLSGGQVPGEIREAAENTFPGDAKEEISALVDKTIKGLKKRITQFDQEETPYLTRVNPKNEDIEMDYDHLSRYREWSVLQKWEDRSQ